MSRKEDRSLDPSWCFRLVPQQVFVMDESTRASLPEPDSVSPVPESVSPEKSDPRTDVDVSSLPPEHRDVMRRLRRRVEEAAETIERLRSEKERLQRRVEELEAEPRFPDDKAILSVDDDPEAVRGRIDQFIDAIDTYLEAGQSEAGSDDPVGVTDDGNS